ncbi:MAG: hypothetical protein Q9170_004501 [Blastenia crenularia]
MGQHIEIKIPTEVVLMILGHLPRPEIKKSRLIAKIWADCGQHLLKLKLDTLYLSARDEEDMDRFDAVTQHSHFAPKIKHLVFDSAQFVEYTMHGYFEALRFQLLDQLMAASDGPSFYIQARSMEEAFARCRSDSVFLDGFRQYCRLVQEQKNLQSEPWFERARRGLQRIGPLESLAIRNTWKTLFFAENDFTDHADEYQGKGWTAVEVAKALLNGDLRLVEDGEFGQSPVARSIPPAVLLPVARTSSWHEPNIQILRGKPVSDGSLEFAIIIELLKSSGQQPLEIMLPGDYRHGAGIPSFVFDSTWPASTSLPVVCQKLESLDIELATHIIRPIHGLQSLFQDSTRLRKLSLTLPYDCEDDTTADYGYHTSHVFSERGCRLPALENLELSGMATSYRDLARLLFIDCPALTSLQLSYIHLNDGSWEDFIEGLRMSDNLQTCPIKKPLTYPDERWYYYNDDIFDQENPGWENFEHMAFLFALSWYINEGGRHPSLAAGEPNGASAKYLVKLNETLSGLRASSV